MTTAKNPDPYLLGHTAALGGIYHTANPFTGVDAQWWHMGWVEGRRELMAKNRAEVAA